MRATSGVKTPEEIERITAGLKPRPSVYRHADRSQQNREEVGGYLAGPSRNIFSTRSTSAGTSTLTPS
jgi:hypothetical protein